MFYYLYLYNNEVNMIVMPNIMYLDYTIEKDKYYINYYLTEMKKQVVLTLSNDNEELNEKIVKKLEEIKEEKKKEQVKTETLPTDTAPKIEKEKKEVKDEIKKSPSTYNDKDYICRNQQP